jgi:hypothetical protein
LSKLWSYWSLGIGGARRPRSLRARVTLLLLGAQRELVLSVHTHLEGVAHRFLSADGGFAEQDSFLRCKKDGAELAGVEPCLYK